MRRTLNDDIHDHLTNPSLMPNELDSTVVKVVIAYPDIRFRMMVEKPWNNMETADIVTMTATQMVTPTTRSSAVLSGVAERDVPRALWLECTPWPSGPWLLRADVNVYHQPVLWETEDHVTWVNRHTVHRRLLTTLHAQMQTLVDAFTAFAHAVPVDADPPRFARLLERAYAQTQSAGNQVKPTAFIDVVTAMLDYTFRKYEGPFFAQPVV